MTRIPFGPTFIDLDDRASIVEYLCDNIKKKNICHVVTLNALMFNEILSDREFREIVNDAGLIIADSIGITAALKFLFGRVVPRIPGIDLIHMLCSCAEQNGYSIYLLGSKQNIADLAKENLKSKYPTLDIKGTHHGYFAKEDENEVARRIKSLQPDILFVGLSSPLQEKWIAKNFRELNIPVVVGVGGSLDVISGKLSRAPRLFQKLGMEWFYRLVQEPWRLKKMKDLPLFMINVIKLKFNML